MAAVNSVVPTVSNASVSPMAPKALLALAPVATVTPLASVALTPSLSAVTDVPPVVSL